MYNTCTSTKRETIKNRSMFGFSLIYHKFSSYISKSNVTITFSSILFVRVTFDRSPALFIQNYQRESLSRSRGVLEEGEEFLSYDTPLEYRSRVSYRWMGNESATDKGGRYTLVNRKKQELSRINNQWKGRGREREEERMSK